MDDFHRLSTTRLGGGAQQHHDWSYAVISYGIRIGEVRIWAPTLAMTIVGVTSSSPAK